jgi:pimeloyl-ACP methyl ester carboxylesterase
MAMQVIMLPGRVTPAQSAYAGLVAALTADADARFKDLEVYSGDSPPPDFSLDTEVRGIDRFADECGFGRFHLLGYSAGGACSLAFAAANSDRLLSLALIEPAWAGNDGLQPKEVALRQAFRALRDASPAEMMSKFDSLQIRDGVAPPPRPEGLSAPWIASRLAALGALQNAYDEANLEPERLRNFRQPVYFALGGLSNPDYYERMADRLSRLFPDFTLEIYSRRHHLDPPHRIEPERVAASLRKLWRRAETQAATVRA